MFRLFIVKVVKRGEEIEGENEGGKEKEREIVACEELSVFWEVLGAALMGLAVFGKKGGGGTYFYMLVLQHALCMWLFALCVSTCVCMSCVYD